MDRAMVLGSQDAVFASHSWWDALLEEYVNQPLTPTSALAWLPITTLQMIQVPASE